MGKLTKAEVWRICHRMKANKDFPAVRRVADGVMSYFDNRCPHCGIDIRGHRSIAYIQEGGDLDLVTYVCHNCGTVYRKYEDTREDDDITYLLNL